MRGVLFLSKCALNKQIVFLLFDELLCSYRKDKKKVDKLQSQIPYHEGRGNKEEVEKIKEQIEEIWERTREAAYAE